MRMPGLRLRRALARREAVATLSMSRRLPRAVSWIMATASVLAILGISILFFASAELPDRVVGALAIVSVLAFIAVGVPISIALLSVGFAGLALLKRDFGIATDTLARAAQGTVGQIA